MYFAKDFRRMVRNQMASVRFDVQEIGGQTVGILGYGDVGRAVANRLHAMRLILKYFLTLLVLQLLVIGLDGVWGAID